MRCDTPMTFEEAKTRLGIVDRQPIPMTNEEYLKTLNTEQFAGFIADVCYELVDDIWANCEDTSCNYRQTEKNYWVKWLKQPHQKE